MLWIQEQNKPLSTAVIAARIVRVLRWRGRRLRQEAASEAAGPHRRVTAARLFAPGSHEERRGQLKKEQNKGAEMPFNTISTRT